MLQDQKVSSEAVVLVILSHSWLVFETSGVLTHGCIIVELTFKLFHYHIALYDYKPGCISSKLSFFAFMFATNCSVTLIYSCFLRCLLAFCGRVWDSSLLAHDPTCRNPSLSPTICCWHHLRIQEHQCIVQNVVDFCICPRHYLYRLGLRRHTSSSACTFQH